MRDLVDVKALLKKTIDFLEEHEGDLPKEAVQTSFELVSELNDLVSEMEDDDRCGDDEEGE